MRDVTLVDVPDLDHPVCGPGREICRRGINLTYMDWGLVGFRDNAVRVDDVLGIWSGLEWLGCGERKDSEG